MNSACKPLTKRCLICSENGEITYRDAIKHADSPNDLRLLIKLESKSANKIDENEPNFSLQSDDHSAPNEKSMF